MSFPYSMMSNELSLNNDNIRVKPEPMSDVDDYKGKDEKEKTQMNAAIHHPLQVLDPQSKQEVILKACQNEDIETIKACLPRADINKAFTIINQGFDNAANTVLSYTVLSYAVVLNKSKEFITALIANGAFVNTPPSHGNTVAYMTPLRLALSMRQRVSPEILAVLKKKAPLEVEKYRLVEDKTCLAAYLGETEFLKRCIQERNLKLPQQNSLQNLRQQTTTAQIPGKKTVEEKMTPLVAAVMGGQLDSVIELLDKNDQIATAEVYKLYSKKLFFTEQRISDVNIFEISLIFGHMNVIDYLIRRFKPKIEGHHINYVSENGRPETFSYLQQYQPDVASLTSPRRALNMLMVAAQLPRAIDVARLILQYDLRGEQLKYQCPFIPSESYAFGFNAFLFSISRGNIELAKNILKIMPELIVSSNEPISLALKEQLKDKSQAKINEAPVLKFSFKNAIIIAIDNQSLPMLEFVIKEDKEKKAQAEMLQKLNMNPLMYAVSQDWLEGVNLLLSIDAGREYFKPTRENQTVLTLAIDHPQTRSLDIVSAIIAYDKNNLLISYKAKHVEGGNVIHYAAFKGALSIMQRLIKRYPNSLLADNGYSILMAAASGGGNAGSDTFATFNYILDTYPEQFAQTMTEGRPGGSRQRKTIFDFTPRKSAAYAMCNRFAMTRAVEYMSKKHNLNTEKKSNNEKANTLKNNLNSAMQSMMDKVNETSEIDRKIAEEQLAMAQLEQSLQNQIHEEQRLHRLRAELDDLMKMDPETLQYDKRLSSGYGSRGKMNGHSNGNSSNSKGSNHSNSDGSSVYRNNYSENSAGGGNSNSYNMAFTPSFSQASTVSPARLSRKRASEGELRSEIPTPFSLVQPTPGLEPVKIPPKKKARTD